uniref:ABC transporter domain-containing protein n=1 Tax=Alexandrium catenella TaxID=2925 RepID=A0A7S1QGG8_ALECA
MVLLRILEPRAGRVLLNDVDICDIGLGTLRSAVGLVPQDPVVFSGTLRHNIDPLGVYSDGRIWHALRCSHLAEYVESLSLGLLHQVADEGGNLSFGQRQLICLARMALRRPGLLLLDEATSAMDPHTQQLVQQAIRSSFPDSTLVAVAHRLEAVLDFDHVVVMERGTVAEQGPVKELANLENGLFRSMLQVKGL